MGLISVVEILVSESGKRSKLKNHIKSTLAEEDVTFGRIKYVHSFIVDPFVYNSEAIYMSVHVEYADQSGTWFVCLSNVKRTRWCWKSDSGQDNLPAVQDEASFVAEVIPRSWLMHWIRSLLFLTIGIGFLIGFVLVIMWIVSLFNSKY
ncbi:MAG: hypothetical protein HRT89_02510 [Lentisphaeria bacterium]|nr:hypothetical protein [Lentisphaeria bacterium]NQZ66921.1 hypothetical protein [Lentisphaeria bacterium]